MVKKYYNFFLLGIFFLIWVWSWWNATDPQNWVSENRIMIIAVPVTFFLVWFFRLSRTSFTLILLFFTLHIIGSRYNYGYVPIGEEIGNFFGTARNSYDRLVHFLFGALTFYPIRELFLVEISIKKYWSHFFSFMAILSMSAIYEIMEWITVLNLNPHEGYLFIGGTDPFDAPKDMLMALTGALLAMSVIIIIAKLSKMMQKAKSA